MSRRASYCVVIFYSADEKVSGIEILPTREAKHLITSKKVGMEKRSFKVYRLGPLFAKCVNDREQ